MKSRADISTAEGSRILTRLCKHWSHRFTVTHDTQRGDIRFDESSGCELQVIPDGLSVEIDAASESGLTQLEPVVAEHLQRMGKGGSLAISWVRGG